MRSPSLTSVHVATISQARKDSTSRSQRMETLSRSTRTSETAGEARRAPKRAWASRISVSGIGLDGTLAACCAVETAGAINHVASKEKKGASERGVKSTAASYARRLHGSFFDERGVAPIAGGHLMTALVQAAVTLRKTARASLGACVAAAFALVPLLGVFRPREEGFGFEHAGLALAWMAWLGTRGAMRFRGQHMAREALWLDLEIGVLLLVGVHGMVQAAGGLDGPLYPLAYVLAAFLAAFAVQPAGILLELLSIAYEGLIWVAAEPALAVNRILYHGVFILFFGVLNVLFTRVEIARVRESSKRERDEEQERVNSDARLFRLAGAPSVENAAS